jgi:AraC-like DNA-binding protein
MRVNIMRLNYKYNIHLACRVILQENMEKLGIPYRINGLGEVHIDGEISPKQFSRLESCIRKYGIEIIDDHKDAIVQQIKTVIMRLVYMNEKIPDSRISSYIAKEMNLSYSYLSKVFSEATHTSIQSYLILQKIERAKQLIIDEKLTFTEVAWKMNYSSVAHLSYQFKKTTGLTPTLFQKVFEKRENGLTISDNP